MNQYAIGIEMDNAGVLTRSGDVYQAWFGTSYPVAQVIEAAHKNEGVVRGWHLFTPEQLFAALEVSSLLVQSYGLKEILGHEDIAPRRKFDPGPAFPMDSFRSRIFGRVDEQNVAPAEYRTKVMMYIRTGPGTQYAPLSSGPLAKGCRLLALDDGGNDWIKVQVIDTAQSAGTIKGWVNKQFVERT
jgi:N-acetylmuramoyl-L-alanine amidase